MNVKRIFFLIFISLLSKAVVAQTGFVNNGMNIKIEQGAYINVNDFTNNNVSGANGSIDLDGSLIVNGDITNNSTGNLFTNIQTTPDGNTILAGNSQSILGSNPIFFENLTIKKGIKTLALNNCEVKGVFYLDSSGSLDLNKNKLILDNSNPSAINYKSGYIKSETTPQFGLGEIEWKIGDAIGTYNIPFGNGLGANNLNLTFKTKTAASPNTGSVIFATYPTNSQNQPYPSFVQSLDTFKPEYLADRFWEIQPVGYTSKPDISIVFKYTSDDVTQANNPNIILADLKAIRYNESLNRWTDMKMAGTSDILNNTVTVDYISKSDFFSYWTLSELVFKLPNAFTPDGDGVNDVFLKGYAIKIINRWGELLYSGSDGWDGSVKGKKVASGTYFFVATVPDFDKNLKTVKGSVTVVLNQ